MMFLPIVARELRVAARKRSTFWLRVVAALAGFVIGGGFIVMAGMSSRAGTGGFGTAALGGVLFKVLTGLGVAGALSAGLFFTSDCLSEEKREGTLGFLFLTDLRGYDVVLGKLLATSLRGFYALLAVLPILAVTMLMGGVTGMQFWKTSLALLNALICSLAAGLLVSSISRDAQRALLATVLFLIVLLAGGPLGDAMLAGLQKQTSSPWLSLSSPGYVFAMAGAWGRTHYWLALAINQAFVCLAILLASLLVPRTWQQKGRKAGMASVAWAHAWKYGAPRRRKALRAKLLGRDPVVWLVCRERWQAVGIWLVTFVVLGTCAVMVATKQPGSVWMAVGWSASKFITWLLYLWAASQACRFFVQARLSGLLELLLAAPLSEKQIVLGHWRALMRLFGLPILLLLGVQVAAACFGGRSAYSGIASGPLGAAANILVPILAVASGIGTIANLIALGWFGMWMGMTSKNNNLATLKTILFVQVIPWFVIVFASGIGSMLLMMPALFKSSKSSGAVTAFYFPMLFSTGFPAVLSVAKAIVFVLWSRRRLYGSLRARAAGTTGSAGFAPSSRLPSAAATPPIIAPTSA
jgi:hypothetical protein